MVLTARYASQVPLRRSVPLSDDLAMVYQGTPCQPQISQGGIHVASVPSLVRETSRDGVSPFSHCSVLAANATSNEALTVPRRL